jgi:peptidoglycan/xylan/chitin deacetylase (PgdA/CDA1 family)
MRAARDAGHQCGIHTWDHVLWHDNVRKRDAQWTRHQMGLAFDRYVDIFGEPPSTHGAAGWQMNAEAFRQIDDWGMVCASDGRGYAPYRVSIHGRALKHVQWPTTLPTLDELIGNPGIDEDNVPQTLLRLTESDRDQVFTLHAELEGGLLAPAFDRLLAGWVAQGHQLVSLAELHQHTDVAHLPCVPVVWGGVPGRSGDLITDSLAA